MCTSHIFSEGEILSFDQVLKTLCSLKQKKIILEGPGRRWKRKAKRRSREDYCFTEVTHGIARKLFFDFSNYKHFFLKPLPIDLVSV